uniref:Saposin B-type domain-containing protein n=1 Tax=Caenorhabditis japonica TaxID=281687 RepID=A0A8R1I115_CAEJA
MSYFCAFTLAILIFTATFAASIPVLPTIKVLTGPNCHMCEIMLNNVRYEYHNNFKDVTVTQLRHSLYEQCDLNFNGFTDQECHRIVDQDAADILPQLQNNTSSYRICQNEKFCC